MAIRVEKLTGAASGPVIEFMCGEIAGLTCWMHELAPRQRYLLRATGTVSRIFFFIGGDGAARCDGVCNEIRELSLFTPGHALDAEIRADGVLQALELRIDLTPEDLVWAEQRKIKPPYFSTYATCKTYREAIKSEKTINRTLLPIDIIPRFCAGTVETLGPDLVAAHKHPMLEQLFVGLPGNDCTVHADDASCTFGAMDLLHIPLGSEHRVRVEPGRKLHYIWTDLFRSDDFSHIIKNHIE